jgi:SPP1 gp7 family putative phage head morphogenesis protein
MAYLELIEYGKDYVQNFELEVIQQLGRVYTKTYKDLERQIRAFTFEFTDEKDKIAEAMKYNRLIKLREEIKREYRKLTRSSIELTKECSTFSYVNGFETNWFNIEKSIGNSIAFGLPPVDAIRASVYSVYSGADFPYRYGRLFTSTTDKIAEAVTRGLAAGLPYKTTAENIKKYFEGSFNDAIRVIRTESTRNFSEGNLYAYDQARKNGIEGVETWLSTFDGRTRDNHAKLNGQEANNGLFKIDGLESRGPGLWGIASMDIACRCSTYYKLAGEDYAPDWKYETWKANLEEWKKESPRMNKEP